MPGRELYRARFGRAGRLAFLGHFQAVIDGVAQQMDERVVDLLDDRAVELGFLAFDHEVDFLA